MQWTRWRRKTSDAKADGEVVWFWHPDAGAKFSWAKSLRERRWQSSPVTGKSAKETVKTIAQGRPGVSGEPVVDLLVCFFISHARLRVRCRARLSLRPFLEGHSCKTRAPSRRESAFGCVWRFDN